MYTVYKIINNLNNKIYVGVHKTENPYDSYMGSGQAIKNAVKKYGKENFTKEILYITENIKEAYDLEKKLTVDFNSNKNYNMKLGGIGGFTKENSWKGHIARSKLGGAACRDKKVGAHALTKEQLSENGRKGGLKNKGRKKGPMTEETKQKIRETLINKNNVP